MLAVNGYIDNNRVVVSENITDWQGRNVIVTILDSVKNSQSAVVTDDTSRDEQVNAAKEIAGLWKSHDEDCPVDDMVRNMRRGRSFDF